MNREKPILYITRDRERAEGIPEDSGFSIISGAGENTLDLIEKTDLPKGSNIVVFKNSKQIEEIALNRGWNLLNPSAELAERIENKITQIAWLGGFARLLPPHEIKLAKDIVWKKTPFILQWAHSHTGEGTFLISKESELSLLKQKFPEREARITEYIKGPMFTVNIVVSSDKILIGNVSYQITGIAPFTDNPFSTIGNDWSMPATLLTEKTLDEVGALAILIGNKMQEEKWKGLFGIDVVYDEERDQIYLIEINARQPASTTYESQLQTSVKNHGIPGITIFEAHLMALSDIPITSPLIGINDGAQIIQRVTRDVKSVPAIHLENAGYKIILYKNTTPNADLARIQSARGIMEAHGKFNTRGKEIEKLIAMK